MDFPGVAFGGARADARAAARGARGELCGRTFGIEAGTRIAVPVPGPPDSRPRLEDPDREAELAQAVELIHAGYAGADDDDVVILARLDLGCLETSASLVGMPPGNKRTNRRPPRPP